MRCLKAVVLALVALLTISVAPSFGATNFPLIAGGSSALFNAMAFAGESGTTPQCVDTGSGNQYNWTATAGAFDAEDLRDTPRLALQKGNVWIEWSTGTGNPLDPPTNVCLYIQLDSMAGLRMFFATLASGQPGGVVDIDPGTTCAALANQGGAHLVPLIALDQPGLPANVCNAIQGLAFNAAPSDFRAEDGKFNTTRILTNLGTCTSGLGYNGAIMGEGNFIQSGISGSISSAQPADFNLIGTDPLTGGTVAHSAGGIDGKAYASLNGGGQVLLVLVNTTDTSSTGFGETTSNPAFTSITLPVLERVLTGQMSYTRDLLPYGTALTTKQFTTLISEPTSGAYTTMDYQGPQTLDTNECQEDLASGAGVALNNPNGGLLPSGWTGTTNPLDAKYTKTSGLKVRAIGEREMVNTIASKNCGSPCQDQAGNPLTNQFGYTFFGFGKVVPAVGVAKYLLVNGVDPLFAYPDQNPGGVGALPTCTVPCPTAVTLTNVENGTYPLWNITRVVTTGTLGASTNGVCNSGATVCQLVWTAQTAVSREPDFAPLSSMNVFRSHSNITLSTGTVQGHNGHNGRYTESGGDVQGKAFTNESDIDNMVLAGAELVNLKE